MMLTKKAKLIEALKSLNVHDHVCLLYSNRREQLAAAIPFIGQGLDRGEKCVYIADENTAAALQKAIRDAGIDVKSALKTGSLVIITGIKDTYLSKGYFDPDLMIQFLQVTTAAAKKGGYSALR